MKVEKLTLAGFRGFDQIDLHFEPEMTVVAGVNGVGKSGVLKALAVAMSHALQRFTVSTETALSLSDSDVQVGKSALSISVTLGMNVASVHTDVGRSAPLESSKAEALLQRRDELRFATRETKKGSIEEQAIKDDLRLIEHQLAKVADVATIRVLPNNPRIEPEACVLASKAMANQPFAVYYSTARLLSKISPFWKWNESTQGLSPYKNALTQLEVSLQEFANWSRVLAEGGNRQFARTMLRQLTRAVRTFLPGVTKLRLHTDRPPRFSVQKNGGRLYLEQLSDGERGLLALVFDLTRRLAIANPDSANPIAEGVALVMIDEVELHLHPKWQRDVIKQLPAIFRNCQFVITTHSPQVIGEVQARCVRLLSTRERKVVVDTPAMAFGTDSNWILKVLMGAEDMNEEVEKELEEVSHLISTRQLDDAKRKIQDLRNRAVNTKAIQLLASTIERIERLGK